MGALSGHMLHPYENIQLSISDLEDIIRKSFSNQMEFVEKVDGYNLHVLITPQKEIRVARSGKDLLNGGIPVEEIFDRFSHNIPFANAIYQAIPKIRKYFETHPASIITFSEYNPITFNLEILRKGVTNIIPYDHFQIVMHGMVCWNKQEEQGYTIDRMIPMGNTPKIRISTNEFTRKVILEDILNRLEDTFGYHESIQDLYFDRMVDFLQNFNLQIPDNIEYFFRYFFDKDQKIPASFVKSQCNSEESIILYNLLIHTTLKNKEFIRQLKQYTIQPLKDLIRYTGNILLHNCHGYLNENMSDMEFLSKYPQLPEHNYYQHKLEGLVFDYKGITYKWTGDFMVINKLRTF